MLRVLWWRILGLVASLCAIALLAWLARGGLGGALRSGSRRHHLSFTALAEGLRTAFATLWGWTPVGGLAVIRALAAGLCASAAALGCSRTLARRRRRYVRLRVEAYRTDTASAQAVSTMFQALHKRLLRRWWRRLAFGQPSMALEVHHAEGRAWLALSCPREAQSAAQAALRAAYPNCRLVAAAPDPVAAPVVLRLKKRARFIGRGKWLDPFEHRRAPPMNHLITAMGASGAQAFVQVALTPAPMLLERFARHLYREHEAHLSRRRHERLPVEDRSVLEIEELRADLDLQHRPLFFVDLRVVAPERRHCELIASELRVEQAENPLIERGTALRHGLLGLYGRRVRRGEGNPLPGWHRGVFASTELAAVWQLPSVDYATVPFARAALPVAPAPSAIWRPGAGRGTLRDAHGEVSLHVEMRKQNTAVTGTVEQGKSSYLVATVAEDLRRERCAVIVLDPKGDAAEAAVSLVPSARICTLLDLAHPTCGFDPLAVDAPADVIADYVVGALRQLFDEADIRASSDRYLRNAIIAVLAYDRSSTLWDAARLLSVGEDGYAYRRRVAARLRELPEFSEISTFFASELAAQLADSRGTTTAKLDAPVNKLARLLNSQSIKRVLLNDSLRVDLDRIIARAEVLVVKGALGAMGAGNTAVVMQLLVGMLDAALARQQDLVSSSDRVAVALKVDEAPLALNRGFAQTMALKRSAGLETVACWQTEAQWADREVREQLDALFAHRVYFATASVRDARAGVELTMAEYSDTVRPGIERLSALGRPDARLHLPRHHAIASWSTPAGRQAPFIAQTIPLRVDRERVALHLAHQTQRGGRYRGDLRQPHWERRTGSAERGRDARGSCAGAPAQHASGAPATHGRAQGPPGGSRSIAEPRLTDRGYPARSAHPPLAGSPAESAERWTPLRPAPRSALPELPASSAPGYRELVELEGAHSVRSIALPSAPRASRVEALDFEILALIACMGHLLSSQVHARFNSGRSVTTTQRRLKRLSDAGLVRRQQFHRRDGGGVPMCYALAPAGAALLAADAPAGASTPPASSGPPSVESRAIAPAGPPASSRRCGPASPWRSAAASGSLGRARRDVRVAGWALAFQRACPEIEMRMRGFVDSALSPPPRGGAGTGVPLGPDSLRLPEGRVAHEFLRGLPSGERLPAERFETVRPSLTIELTRRAGGLSPSGRRSDRDARQAGPGRALDLLLELDRPPVDRCARALESYDHFLAGWSAHTTRYGARSAVVPVLVLICRDRSRARARARMADAILTACRAYPGEYPADWQYLGRESILCVAERDIHEGSLCGYGVSPLPPAVRASLRAEDPGSRAAAIETRELSCAPVRRQA